MCFLSQDNCSLESMYGHAYIITLFGALVLIFVHFFLLLIYS